MAHGLGKPMLRIGPIPTIFGEISSPLRDNIGVTNYRLGLRVSALIFAIVAVAHLIRILVHIELKIGDRLIPMWPSVLAVVIAGFLGVWLWRLSRAGGAP